MAVVGSTRRLLCGLCHWQDEGGFVGPEAKPRNVVLPIRGRDKQKRVSFTRSRIILIL